jgi:diguanylate cyclase (GGDEF)-like protein
VTQANPTHTILIADDEKHLRGALEMLFKSEGFKVLVAADGEKALSTARSALPDVIVLDVMMPGLDGYEVCRRLRSHFRTRHIPILMLTAKDTDDDKIEGLTGGANDYVTKPWSRAELVQRVRNHLEWATTQKAVNPLTGLPGGVSILSERQTRFDKEIPFGQLMIDVDYFKAFNDRYGFTRGDEAIKKIAEILTEVVESDDHPDNFLGHIGGDDFVVLTTPERSEHLAEEMKESFDRAVPSLYVEKDREQGFVRVRNRRHQFENFPLMSLTIALATSKDVEGMHLAQLDDALTELKTLGKGMQGSVVVSERRRRKNAPAEADADTDIAGAA